MSTSTSMTPDPDELPVTSPDELPEHVAANREAWDRYAPEYVAAGERAWACMPGQETWGIFGFPESQVGMLPDDLAGLDVIELGCGTAYVSAWLARRGARSVGIDNSPKQLETAARLQREHGIDFPLLLGQRRAGPLPRRLLRLRDQRVRRRPVGRPVRVGPRGRPPPPSRRPPPRAHQRAAHPADRSAGRRSTRGRSAPASAVRDAPRAVGGRDLRTSSTWPTASGSGCSARVASRSRSCWSRRCPRTRTSTYAYVPVAWARQWPAEEIWKVRKRR